MDLEISVIGTGRLRFTTQLREDASSADVHFACLGTPQAAAGSVAASS